MVIFIALVAAVCAVTLATPIMQAMGSQAMGMHLPGKRDMIADFWNENKPAQGSTLIKEGAFGEPAQGKVLQ